MTTKTEPVASTATETKHRHHHDEDDNDCLFSSKAALNQLDPDLYQRITRGMKSHGCGTIESLRGLSKPQIVDILASMGKDPDHPGHDYVCPTWRGRVADVLMRYFDCGKNDNNDCGRSATSAGEDVELFGGSPGGDGKSTSNDKTLLTRLLETMQSCNVKLKTLRGLTRTQLIAVFTEMGSALVKPEHRGDFADALLSYFRETTKTNEQLSLLQQQAEEHEEQREEGLGFMASLVRYQSSNQPFKNKLIDEMESTSSFLLWMGALERPAPLLRATLIEFVITGLFSFVHIGIVRTAVAGAALVPPILPIAFFHFLLIVASIFAAAPSSGCHMNPLVSMATAFSGHQTVLRSLLYIIAQLFGASLGAVLHRASVGGFSGKYSLRLGENATAFPPSQLAACTVGDLDTGMLFTTEFVSAFMVLFIIGGILLHPTQFNTFGPVVGPLLFAMGLMAIIYSTGGTDPKGGGGAQFNFALCFGSAIASNSFEVTHWIYLVADLFAAAAWALLFLSIPPHHETDGAFFVPMLLQEKRKHLKREHKALAGVKSMLEFEQQMLLQAEEEGAVAAGSTSDGGNNKKKNNNNNTAVSVEGK